MTTEQFLSSAWNWNPWVIAVCVAVILIYGARQRFHFTRKTGWLLAGLALFFLALTSPLATLADGYLSSAHMLQQLLLLLVVPSLILLSLSPAPVPARFETGPWQWLNWILNHPLATWFLFVGSMWLWHAPALAHAAMTNAWIHWLQCVSMLLAGFAFWWPIIGPWRKQWLPPLVGMVYLFSACVGCTILGIIITFAPLATGSIFDMHPPDPRGILPLIQNQWGLTPARDQQLGGLLMWVPACLIYMGGIFGLFARWHGEPRDEAIAFPTPLISPVNPALGKSHGH